MYNRFPSVLKISNKLQTILLDIFNKCLLLHAANFMRIERCPVPGYHSNIENIYTFLEILTITFSIFFLKIFKYFLWLTTSMNKTSEVQ